MFYSYFLFCVEVWLPLCLFVAVFYRNMLCLSVVTLVPMFVMFVEKGRLSLHLENVDLL